MIKSYFNRILGINYQNLNSIEISRENLYANYKYLSSLNPNLKIAPVLKSNAYGHGLKLIGIEIDKLNPPLICVDSLFEAYELLNAKIKAPILIMGYIHPKSIQTKRLPFSYAVYDFETVQLLDNFQKKAKIHIFLDTGMHREGILLKNLKDFATNIKENTSLEIEGLMSHFAESEAPNSKLTIEQIKNFNEAQRILSDLKIKPKWIHIANSEGVLNNKKLGKIGNLGRCGISLYGLSDNKNLKQVIELKTRISQIKELEKGEKVGYNGTYQTKREIKIATLPIGYFDGLDRDLSNKGFVKIKNRYAPIIGRISMNITTIDISNIKNVKINDDVTVFSNNTSDKNSLKNSSQILSKIPYELLIHISPLIKRSVV